MGVEAQRFARLWPFIRPSRRWLWLVGVMTPLGVLAGLAQPLLLKYAIDDLIGPGEMEGLGVVVSAFMGVVAIAFGARALGLYALQQVGLQSLARLRKGVFEHVLSQGQRFFDKHATGALMTRTTNDVEAIYESLAFGAVQLLTDGLTIVGTLVAMLALDWELTGVSLALTPLIVFIVDVCRRRLRALSLEIRRSLSRLNGFFELI